MGLEVRVTEDESGCWACSIGVVHFDTHQTLGEAVLHMQTDAPYLLESELWVHFNDGISELVAIGPLVHEA